MAMLVASQELLASQPSTHTTQQLDVTGVFIAIGHTPNTKLFENQLDMAGGYITIHSGLNGNVTQTSKPGVYAAGDVADHVLSPSHYPQLAFGCMAALDAEKYLDKLSESSES